MQGRVNDAVGAAPLHALFALALSSLLVAGCISWPSSGPPCTTTPALTEGPYFVDNMPHRSNIRTDSHTGKVEDGVPLRLKVTVVRPIGSACLPWEGAQVDVWHTNASGVYSGVAQEGTQNVNFLRGNLVTNETGVVEFSTIYPGWYSGRAIHIHFKVRSGSFSFTSQWFIDEAITNTVIAQPPYNARGAPDVRNLIDGLYNSQLLLTVTPDGAGYLATYTVVVTN
jgi:protocatechuate 3,4-dioxygenase beta subunit